MMLDEAITNEETLAAASKGPEAAYHRQVANWLRELLESRVPVPMLLWCPLCHERHIDKGEFAARPHHAHCCQNPTCGFVWRPSIHTTVGVQFLPGFQDEPSDG